MSSRPIHHLISDARSGRHFFILILSLLAPLAHAADPFADVVRKTEPLTPEQEQLAFHLPPGFEVQLVAAEPDIGKPINLAFDVQGRLWVTQSREYPYAAPLDKPGRHVIKVVSDFDANGRARRATTCASRLNIPAGPDPSQDGVMAFRAPDTHSPNATQRDGHAATGELPRGRFGLDRDVQGLTGAFRRGYGRWL